jgi:hypothetical protein
MGLVVGVAFAAAIVSGTASDAISAFATSLYSAKTNSASAHISSLVPEESMLDISFPMPLLFGTGGFSENFYWRILMNFGWTGFAVVVSMTILSLYYSLRGATRWRNSIAPWMIAVLIGSNGIAYLLTFPLNLLYWSTLALLIRETESEERAAFSASGQNTSHYTAPPVRGIARCL